MTDRDALLAAVIAAPDDDAPRLILADWYEENGEPERAEFVGAQIAEYRLTERLAELPIPGPQEETNRLAWLMSRSRELLNDHDYWDCLPFPSYPLLVGVPPAGRNGRLFRRGFVESVTLSAAAWMEHGDALLAAHPVTEVRLTTLPEPVFYPPKWDAPHEFGLSGDPAAKSWTERQLADAGCEHRGREELARTMLSLRWPALRTWHLPPDIQEALEAMRAWRDSLPPRPPARRMPARSRR